MLATFTGMETKNGHAQRCIFRTLSQGIRLFLSTVALSEKRLLPEPKMVTYLCWKSVIMLATDLPIKDVRRVLAKTWLYLVLQQ